jgi:uncharacterized protein (TIGR02757 family)
VKATSHNPAAKLLVLLPRKPDAVLKRTLDRFVLASDKEALVRGDPVELVHRYSDPEDQEVAGLLVAMLAYGRVASIKAKASRALELLGKNPARAIADQKKTRALSGFIYRFQSGEDVPRFLGAIARVRQQYGSLASAFAAGTDARDPHYALAMDRFTARLTAAVDGPLTGGLRFLLPGGAAKRLALYLRWMVRDADGVDLGAFPALQPGGADKSKLIIPLDTHIERIGRYLGLTDRKGGGQKTAIDITTTLQRLCPADPLVYDLALCHLGISGLCPRRRDVELCADCQIKSVCRLGDRPSGWRW